MNVGEKQKNLSHMATQNKSLRFYDLYSLLSNRDWLRVAWQHVCGNAGSRTPGIDGVTIATFNERLEEHLEALRGQLKAKQFEPLPVRRVYIPKANGKRRPLGIPSIKDRIVQEALRMILEPIWEADFSQHSYGFRPNRCTMDAVSYIGHRLVGQDGKQGDSYQWVIEGDITSYFDTINHRKLMKLLAKRIEERALLDLIWKFLKAGILEGSNRQETLAGTPQGGICSPLLANIYLHELDRYMEEHYVHLSKSAKERRRKQRLPNYLYVRYCDDFVVLCNGTKAQATAMKEELYTFLKTRLKLELSQDKTTVTHVTDGFTFLGFRIVKEVGTSGKRVPKILIPEEAIRKFRHKIHETLAPHTHHDSVNMKIMALNRITGGWCRYYQCTSSASLMFGKLNPIVFWDMAHWLGRKFRLSMPQVMKTYYANSTFHTSTQSLIQPGNYRTKRYTSHPENNPYLTNPHQTRRETIPTMEAKVREKRPGQADLREALLARTGPICTQCGYQGTTPEMHVDHKIPRHRFKHPTEADHIGNVQILCVTCHKAKTKRELQVLSRVR